LRALIEYFFKKKFNLTVGAGLVHHPTTAQKKEKSKQLLFFI